MVFLTAAGGLTSGIAMVFLSPPGWDAADLIGVFALVLGSAATGDLLVGKARPVPYLIAIAAMVGVLAPFADLALTMVFDVVLVSVLSTAALLLDSTRAFWAMTLLTMAAGSAAPVLTWLDLPGAVALTTTPGVLWTVSVVVLAATAVGFRALRDRLIRRDTHQREMNALISSLAHSLRTPLTPVIGFAHLLEAEQDTQSINEYAHRIVSRAWEMSERLDDLIIIARSDAESLEMLERRVDITLALDGVIAHIPGAEDRIRHRDTPGVATGDPHRVRHILRHLLSNAVEHGGPNVSLTSSIRGSFVTLRVEDDGEPLSPETLDGIFDVFDHRSDMEDELRLGVGLKVSRILARAMGGDVDMESGVAGNVAVLTLPVVKP